MQSWVEETGNDGFSLIKLTYLVTADVSNPMFYEDIVKLLVPELQKRDLMWQGYHVKGGTFREYLHNIPGEPGLSPRHPGSKFKWSAQANEKIEMNGNRNRNGKVKTNGHTVPVVVGA